MPRMGKRGQSRFDFAQRIFMEDYVSVQKKPVSETHRSGIATNGLLNLTIFIIHMNQ
jgi:hypothetical protein